jgi:uncharacterized protein YacL
MAVLVLRAIFVAVSVGIAALIIASPPMRDVPIWVPWTVLFGMISLPLAAIAIDCSLRRKDVTVITAIYFGLLVGLFLAYVASLVLAPILPTDPNHPVTTWLPLILGTLLCYVCTSLLLQTRDDFRFLIPYVEFARDVKGLRPNILDSSAIVDGRVADLAETGLFQSRFVVPAFVVDELQASAESSDRQQRLRGRRGLDVLAKLRGNKSVDIEVLAANDDAAADSSEEQRLVAMALQLDGRLITSDPNCMKIAGIRSVNAVNINDLAVALKPTFVPGDMIEVRLVKPGESAGQGVGYLDDGTMVVVEGGREQIGRLVHASVTSTLQTSAGRLVFARPEFARN